MARRKRNRKNTNGRRNRRRDDRNGADLKVGYFAYCGIDALCDHDACIITGSKQAMRNLLDRLGPEGDVYTIRATTAAEVLAGIGVGAAYALDEQAYGLFLAPAQEEGLPIGPEDFSDPGPIGLHFVRVQVPAPFEPSESWLPAVANG